MKVHGLDQRIETGLHAARFNRRSFLRLSAAGALGSLPFWRGGSASAAEAASTVSEPPVPVVDARFPCRIADGIWLIPDKRTFLVPNIGIVEGEKAVLVIDSGLNPESGRNVLGAAHAIAGKRELILTVTHAHPEHTFGAQAFKGQARIYYNQLQRDYLARNGKKLLAGFRTLLPPERVPLLADVQVTLADEVYDGEQAYLDLGGRRVEFWTLGTAHSPGDQVIVIPDQAVVFAGDLIEERMFPIVPFFPPLIEASDINVLTWQAALAKITAQAPRLIVPGHGNLGGTEIADEVRGYLEATRQIAVANQNKTVGTAPAPQLAETIRGAHPTWEHPEFISPAIKYFAEHPEG